MHTVTIDNIIIGPGHPLVLIAGPCVLESRDLVFTIAESVCRLTTSWDSLYFQSLVRQGQSHLDLFLPRPGA